MKRRVFFLCSIIWVVLLAACAAPAAVYNGSGSRQTTVALRIAADDEDTLYDGDVTIVDNSPTAYMALRASRLPVEINAQDTPDIMFLNGVDGIYSDDPAYWTLYVNGAKAEFGMGIEPVKDGDVVEFIYEDRSDDI